MTSLTILRKPYGNFLRVLYSSLFILHCSLASASSWEPHPPGPLRAQRPAFTRLDSLFLIAATGEPRFQSARDSSEKILRALDTETLGYLIGRPADQTPRQRQYMERLFVVIADSGRNPASRNALARAVAGAASDSARAQWLYIGSRTGDTAFRAIALPWLGSPSEVVRRMAVRVLGACPRPENLPLLWTGLDTLRGLELHQRLWALEAHSPLRDWKRLVPLLGDGHYFNRRKVRDMLLKATDSSWAELSKILPETPGGGTLREWRFLAGAAKGGRAYLETQKVLMTADERRFFGI